MTAKLYSIESVREGIRLRRDGRSAILPWGALASMVCRPEYHRPITTASGARAVVEDNDLIVRLYNSAEPIKVPLTSIRAMVAASLVSEPRNS